MNIWAACRVAVEPRPLEGELIRIVASQEQVATNALVENLDEQALLEEMLESSKPPLSSATAGLHYLLATPFRYPPLRHGSRFGSRHEPGLFYGAIEWSAVLAETAYYRLVFWAGMTVPPPAGRFRTEHAAFGACYAAQRGLNLHEEPFSAFEERLMNPKSYADTQQLGRNLREVGIEAITYLSARDPDHGVNIALFHPRAFSKPGPVWQQPWLCDTQAGEVSFYSKDHGTWRFPREAFLVDGELPTPPG